MLVPEGTREEEYIIYRVLDELTDAYYPVVDHFEERIDVLEEMVLNDTDRQQLTEIYRLKQQVLTVQRRVASQRDQFGQATEAILGLPGLTHGSRPYLRDIGDHLAQVTQELYRQADDLGALTSTYFNANANRLNRLATRLTVLATFFLIWTLVTSFFGQNFGWLVGEIDSLKAFLIYDGIGLVIPTILAAVYFWRRRREWL
jgi:magnesium transporter